MGAFNGTISYSLFRTDAEVPADYKDRWLERIEKNGFVELTPDGEEDMSVGWVVSGRMLQVDFQTDNVFIDNYLTLSMRTDRWSLPAPLLKAHVARRIEQVCEERGRAKLSRTEREDIRTAVMQELRGIALPAASMVDMVWNLDTRVVRFWSQSGRALEVFEELFEDTFGLRLIGSSAYVEALECGLDDELIGRLADVAQAEFIEMNGGR